MCSSVVPVAVLVDLVVFDCVFACVLLCCVFACVLVLEPVCFGGWVGWEKKESSTTKSSRPL